MIRVAISCGEGFASGFLAKRLETGVIKNHYQDRVSFERIPYPDLYDNQDRFDVAMILPHIEWKVNEDKKEYKIPLYIIPFKVPVAASVEDYIEDAEDIIKEANGKGGKFSFNDEPRTANVIRLMSHRRWVGGIDDAWMKSHPIDEITNMPKW